MDIALLQETHLRPLDMGRMQNKYYMPIVASGDGSKTKGVMILMKRNTNIQVEKVLAYWGSGHTVVLLYRGKICSCMVSMVQPSMKKTSFQC